MENADGKMATKITLSYCCLTDNSTYAKMVAVSP
jgi:hypothetical protein